MKNLKIAKKFIVSFGIILTLFLVSVVASCAGVNMGNSAYDQFYEEDYQTVSRLYEMRVGLRRLLSSVLLAAESSGNDVNAREAEIESLKAEIQTNYDWIKANYEGEGDISKLAECEAILVANEEILNRAAAALTSGNNTEAIRIVTEEYEPALQSANDLLVAVFNEIDGLAKDNFEQTSMLLTVLLIAGIVIAVVAFAITMFIALNLSASISAPVKEIEASMKEIVKGNLSVQVNYEAGDEFGSMAESMREVTSGVSTIVKDIEKCLGAMADGDFTVHSSIAELYVGDYSKIIQSMKKIKDSFNDTLATLSRSANQVSSGSDQVSSGAQALSQGATEQASSVEELAASINEISNNINQTAHQAQEASGKSMQVGQKAGESNERMQDMLQAMADINSSSGEIGKIIKTIEDIAFQTNILALNAAVEAARAGAAGKGFAVVADEVRNLASKSAEASKNTAALIENSLQAVENGKNIADETARSLQDVIADIQEASSMMDMIARAATDQAESISQITLGIDQISSVVQTNSATAEESAAASEELSGQAQILNELVRKFRLEGDAVGTVSGIGARASSYEPDYGMDMSISYGGNDKY